MQPPLEDFPVVFVVWRGDDAQFEQGRIVFDVAWEAGSLSGLLHRRPHTTLGGLITEDNRKRNKK